MNDREGSGLINKAYLLKLRLMTDDRGQRTEDSALLSERSYKLAECKLTIQEPSDIIFKCLLLFN
jgi:hypothetical protein